MSAPPKAADVPVLEDPTTLQQYDAFLIGIPTRYGNFPAQWKVRRQHRFSLFPVQFFYLNAGRKKGKKPKANPDV